MIASLGAVGLAPGLGSSGGPDPVEIPDEDLTPAADETATSIMSFDGPQKTIDASKPHKAIITTNQGTIELQLYTDAPQAVNSFAFLAGNNFFDGQYFFYVDREFVAQAGDPTCSTAEGSDCGGAGGPGYNLPLEKTTEGHEQWAVVAPSTGVADQVHGSQFRILFQADDRLDGRETVFGKVVAGQEILEGLSDFVPCSVASDIVGCAESPDVANALVIEDVTVEPA
jgi:cyclophilin family peptidyl-prolyl cis-trans isomerase